MIIDNNVTVACRCPSCGGIIKCEVTMLGLSVRPKIEKCPECGRSHLDISLSQDSKVKLSVPCLACAHPHPFSLSPDVFFGKELYLLPCSYSGFDVCFFGISELVDKALFESGKALENLYESQAHDTDGKKRESALSVADYEVTEEILYALEDLQLANTIRCKCEDGEQKLSVVIGYDKVTVRCDKCKMSHDIDSKSRFDLNAILDVDELYLE